jgi:hypothetical protein
MNKKVYIIAISSADSFWIKHICASEKIAMQRFKDIKIEMILEEMQAILLEIHEYKNLEGVYAPKYNPTQEARDGHFEHSMEHSAACIKRYMNSTFEKPAKGVNNKPVCEIYDLEE